MTLRLAGILSWAVLAAGVAVCPARAEESCKPLQRVVALPMTTENGSRVTIPMIVAGHPMDMLVDTGGILTMITEREVKALHLPTDNSVHGALVLFGGTKLNKTVTADIQLGSMIGKNRKLFVWPADLVDVDGVLAPDTLRAFDADFDFANATLNLFSQDHCPHRVVYWTKDTIARVPFEIDGAGHIVLKTVLDGQSVDSILDTGAYRTVTTLGVVKERLGIATDDPNLKKRDDGRLHYPFKSLSVGGLQIDNPDIEILPAATTKPTGDTERMIIGMNVIRQLHLYIAYGEHFLYVTPASAH